LRIQTNPENRKEFKEISNERYVNSIDIGHTRAEGC
jgi:hypothetical protein